MRYSISMNDGSVAVMQVISGTIDEAVAKWPQASRDMIVQWSEIADEEIPDTRTFRAAWEYAGPTITIDMVKARQIITDNLAVRRTDAINALPAKIDAAQMRGQNTASLKARLRELKRMNLVEFRNKVHHARTPEALLALWPRDLPWSDE